jgi:Right handed beta helix region
VTTTTVTVVRRGKDAAVCDLAADPGVGTAQAAVDSARPGQTVCLHGGIYTSALANDEVVSFRSGNKTLQSYPGERATLQNLNVSLLNPLYIPFGSNNVTVRNLNVRGPYGPTGCVSSCGASVKVIGSNVRLQGLDVTNDQDGGQCLLAGSASSGRADDLVVTDSVFHDCGRPNNTELECTYFANTQRLTFAHNLVYDCSSHGIQIYPSSGGGLFERNTVDNGAVSIRGPLVLGGYAATSNNEIRRNIFVQAANVPVIQTCFSDQGCGPAGPSGAVSGNTVHDNCLFSFMSQPDFENPIRGLTQANNTHANPLFVDRARRNYRPQNRACMGKGR